MNVREIVFKSEHEKTQFHKRVGVYMDRNIIYVVEKNGGVREYQDDDTIVGTMIFNLSGPH